MNVIVNDRVSMAFCGVLSKVSLGSGTLFKPTATHTLRAPDKDNWYQNKGEKKTRKAKALRVCGHGLTMFPSGHERNLGGIEPIKIGSCITPCLGAFQSIKRINEKLVEVFRKVDRKSTRLNSSH